MNKLEKYWETYDSDTSTSTDTGNFYTVVGDGYRCSRCGQWIYNEKYHFCTWPSTWISGYVYPIPNKTEQAFKILKALVESKIIREPTSFKKFCDLIEKIAGII